MYYMISQIKLYEYKQKNMKSNLVWEMQNVLCLHVCEIITNLSLQFKLSEKVHIDYS